MTKLFKAIKSPYLITPGANIRVSKIPTKPSDKTLSKKICSDLLNAKIEELRDLQRRLYASDHHAILLIFQAMDAAGKDSTIRAVMSGVNPAGCQVFSFKRPSQMELDHDFLWRTTCCLPERGRIGIFNRSYYEEVLAVRVHPEFLKAQRLPHQSPLPTLWKERFESINDFEKHIARNGTVILKFWLNVSKEEQKQRFLSRIDRPEKNWKFNEADVHEREHWQKYMKAYEDTLNNTSTAHAPWYAIPADNKPFTRLKVAEIIVETLKSLKLTYPKVAPEEHQELQRMRRYLLKK